MKKIILSIALFLSGIIPVNAQFNIGGSVNFNTSTIKPESEDKVTSKSFSISPSVGYRLNEKWEVGISLAANNFDSKQLLFMADGNGNISDMLMNESNTKEYLMGTYIRYKFVEFYKFSIHGLFNIYAGKGKSENTFLFSKGNSEHTLWGVSICPVGMFDLSNKFTIFANLNFFSLGIFQNKVKEQHTTTEFNFMTDANNILPAIGLIYNF